MQGTWREPLALGNTSNGSAHCYSRRYNFVQQRTRVSHTQQLQRLVPLSTGAQDAPSEPPADSEPLPSPSASNAVISPPQPPPSTDIFSSEQQTWQKGWQLTRRTFQLVWQNAWHFLLLFAACDAAVFLLHRVCHRITNEVALRFLLPQDVPATALIGRNLWFLASNPDVANFQTGYQWVVGIMFVAMFPINILLRTLALATSQLLLAKSPGDKTHPGWLPPVRKMRGQVAEGFRGVKTCFSRLWQVDLLVAVQALPLQALSLLVLPLPWSLPKLLKLQLAAPISLFEGDEGDEAVKKSRVAMEPLWKVVAFPYAGLLLAAKALAVLGEVFFTRVLTPRVARELPEIPMAVYVVVAAATLLLNRMQDLLPFVTYSQLRKEAGQEPSQLAAAPQP